MSSIGARERDPHFRKILEGLAGHVDHQLFEECIIDLLRDAFPSLVAIHGGSDAGMDGAIADGDGEAYPLIATTSGRVIRNLTESLRSYVAADGSRRRAVVATSTALAPAERRSLERRARERGFVLLQTFDRRDIASRLYRDSKWTQRLLGITGEPPALTAIPRTRRPRFEIEPVGREADIEWLRAASGDRLLVGEPGSGKTFLLFQLVREGKALFLGTDDEARLADAYRDMQPEIILVDDAHLESERIDSLRQLREHEADFAIVATCWEGAADDVADALGGLTGERVRHLELLTRAEILEVLRRLGVQEPDGDPYLIELVNQAANRPGLAVTLGALWLRGEYRDVLTGQALRRSLIPTLRQVMEHDPSQLLAAFALGGERGMGLQAVADFLAEGVGEVWERATRIGSSGVLTDRGRDETGEAVLAVQPATLRTALLHEVFFSSLARAWEPLLRHAPSLRSAIDTLVQAAQREVPVPRVELRTLLMESGSSQAWRGFALLGQEEGAWVLEHYPGETADIAQAVLEKVPKRAIRLLLQQAESKRDRPDSRTSDPLRILRDWVQGIPSSDAVNDSLKRRRELVDAVLEHLEECGDRTVGLRAAFRALSPRLEGTGWSAAGGLLITRQGSLPASTVPEMLRLWEKVRTAIRALDRESWAELSNTLHWWIHPNLPSADLSDEELQQFHEMPRRILRDLVPFAEGHPGLASAFRELAEEVDLDLDLPVDPVFETLFADSRGESSEDPLAAWKEQVKVAERLAQSWARRSSEDAIDDLVRYLAEAEWRRRGGPGTISEFGEALAREADRPEEWLGTLLERKGPSVLLSPFLYRVVEEQSPGWKGLLESCLETEEHRWTASARVLRLREPPDDVLQLVLDAAEPQVVKSASLSGKVPVATLRRLLCHSDPNVRAVAAVGEWLAEPRENVRPEVAKEWREAILSIPEPQVWNRPGEEFWLKQILSKDAELAFDWLRAQLAAPGGQRPLMPSRQDLAPAVIAALERTQRARLVAELEPASFSTPVLSGLIDDDAELYRALLQRNDLRNHHLAPLAGKPPDAGWADLARLALEAGHDAREIAAASFELAGIYSPSVEYYSKWEKAFRWLSESQAPGLKEVARHGLRQAEELVENARDKEHQRQLTGQF